MLVIGSLYKLELSQKTLIFWKSIEALIELTNQDIRSKHLLLLIIIAAAIEGLHIEIDDFTIPNYSEETLIIEGAGGLHVPLNDEHLIIDLIEHFKTPVILVSKNYLGSINHTLLSIEALKRRNIPILGVLFNGDKNRSTQEYITQHTGVKYLGRIDQAQEITEAFIEQQAKQLKDEKITITY